MIQPPELIGKSRLGPIEWLHAVRDNAMLPGLQKGSSLDWVLTTPYSDIPREFSVQPSVDGERFFHIAYRLMLPPLMSDSASGGDQGGPRLQAAIEMLFAPLEWMIQTRAYLHDSLSPRPGLLKEVIEAFGIDATVHQHDLQIMSRIMAGLPEWIIHQGELEAALALLEHALDTTMTSAVLPPGLPGGGTFRVWPLGSKGGDSTSMIGHNLVIEGGAAQLPLGEAPTEVFLCHKLSWYGQRKRGSAHLEQPLFIQHNLVHVPSTLAASFTRSSEDICIDQELSKDWLCALLRLLPVWADVRVHFDPTPSR